MIYSPSLPEQAATMAFAQTYVANQRGGGAGRHNGSQRVNQAYKSKLAEYAWASLVGGHVDLNHHKPHFGPDLQATPTEPIFPMWKGYDLHVKSCSIQRGRDSWLIDNADPVLTNPSIRDLFLLAKHDDLVGNDDIELVGLVRAQAVNTMIQPSATLDHKSCFYYYTVLPRIIPIW